MSVTIPLHYIPYGVLPIELEMTLHIIQLQLQVYAQWSGIYTYAVVYAVVSLMSPVPTWHPTSSL